MNCDSTANPTSLAIEPILEKLKSKTGVDFAQYRRSTIQRRLERRMLTTRCQDETVYMRLLDSDPDECRLLLSELTIKFSEFFRDPALWEMMSEKILPGIIQTKTDREDKEIRAWSAGCAMGEEAFTIAMVFDRLLKEGEDGLDFSVTATDLDDRALEHARAGAYSHAVTGKVPPDYLVEYFHPHGKNLMVDERLRSKVNFRCANLLDCSGADDFGPFDLILCRNVLIYLNRPLQSEVFDHLLEALSPGGILVLGPAEIPPQNRKDRFYELNHELRVMQLVS